MWTQLEYNLYDEPFVFDDQLDSIFKLYYTRMQYDVVASWLVEQGKK